MSFQEKIEAIRERLRAQPLRILIWGPAPNNPAYMLRQQIHFNLTSEFRNSSVVFSEDLESEHMPQGELSASEVKLMQVASCDLVIALVGSPGSLGEIDYLLSSSFGHKFLLVLHEQFKDSLSLPIRLRSEGNILSYSDYDLQTCSIVEKIADQVRVVALAKMARLLV